MKKLFLFLTITSIFNACTNDDFIDIESNQKESWKMIGYLSDPGDGSGTYTNVESNKTINFFGNGTFSSNGNICNMLSTATGSNVSGIYDFQNLSLNATECNNQTSISIRYQIIGDTMYLFYPCREACYVKYLRQ